MPDSLTKPVTGRHTGEIEITPQTVEAGVQAAALFDATDSLEMIERELFSAMSSVSEVRPQR
jgi:hypothetical protein